MYREFFTRNTRTKVREIIFTEDERLREDGYRIRISADGTVRGSFHGMRGKRYAQQTLSRFTNEEGTLIAEVEDYPSFAIRGIIEGFYGTPYSDEMRRELLEFASAHRYNAYFYAPKDDCYHRDRWREPYPADLLHEIGQLKEKADENYIDFYYCLSPGKDFCYASEEDYRVLLKKYEEIAALGVKNFAVLFDDISSALSERDAALFSCAAEAHCAVANCLNRSLEHEHKIIFCPTDYFQNTDTDYRKAVRKYLDEDIAVIWTGYNTVAEVIPERDCIAAKESFERELILWDNYPVNDFEPKRRIYLGEICNRTKNIAAYHGGCIANVSELWQSSRFALCTMGEWMWNAENYDGESAYRRAVKELLDDSDEALFFVGLSRSSVMRTYSTVKEYFDREEWAYLNDYYFKAECAACYVRSLCGRKLEREWRDLIEYVLTECKLYKALRAGEKIEPLLDKMKSLRYRTADQSILRYIAEKKLGKDITEPERTVYWNTEKE